MGHGANSLAQNHLPPSPHRLEVEV